MRAKPRCTVCGKEPPAVVIQPNKRRLSGFDSYCDGCKAINHAFVRRRRERERRAAA
jgi:hypothetical protein